jgi:hypothetical protein
MGLQLPRGRPAEIHDRQSAASEIKIQNGGTVSSPPFFVFENQFVLQPIKLLGARLMAKLAT